MCKHVLLRIIIAIFIATAPQSHAWAQQYGCLTPYFCILGWEDVAPLADNAGSLGFKIVGTGEVEDGGRSLGFKLFDIFDIGDTATRHPLIRVGGRIAAVDRQGFHDERTLEEYVRSKRAGEIISLDISSADGSTTEEVKVKIVSTGITHFKTQFRDFVTFEQAVQLARIQSVKAAISAASEMAPYLLLYNVGTMNLKLYGNSCIILSTPC